MVTLPPMIRMIFTCLQRQFDAGLRAPFGVKTVQLGEIYRADAKAEGELIVLGGWESAILQEARDAPDGIP